MDNSNSEWVDDRMASLEPPASWQPNSNAALTRLRSRVEDPRRRTFQPRLTWVAAGALGCAALMAVPQARMIAQHAWELVSARRVEVVSVDLGRLPEEAESLGLRLMSKADSPLVVNSVQELAARTGFAPQVPTPGVVSGERRLAVIQSLSFGTTIQRKHVDLALRQAGITDEAVPGDWDGAQLAVHFGPIAVSEWEGTTLMELKPPTISTPPGFDLSRFVSLTLRAAGLEPVKAQQVAARIMAAPAIVLAVSPDEPVTLTEVRLRAGTGTLIHDKGEDGDGDRVTLVWGTADRLFVISTAHSQSFAVRLADALTP